MIRWDRLTFWVLAVLLFLGAPGAWGQSGQSDKSKASARERVHQLIVTRIANELKLGPTETQKLGGVLKKYKQNKHRLRYQIQQLTAQLRQDTASGNEQATQTTLKKLQQAQEELDKSDEVMFAEVKTMLTPNQVAQFVLVMDEIRHEVRAVKRRGRRNYQGGPQFPYQAPGQKPAAQPQQRQLTNQPPYAPYPPGYGNGYVNPYRPNPKDGVWVGD